MPNSYHYFESGEVSQDRLLLEIELLKQLQAADLLHDLEWKSYDTFALNLFLQAGIEEVNEELSQRYPTTDVRDDKQTDFIDQCLRKHQTSPLEESFKQQRTSSCLLLNATLMFICLLSALGLYIYQDIRYKHKHHSFRFLDQPLTSKRRQLSFTDDLLIILLAFTTSTILGFGIFATRFNRKLLLLEIGALVIVIILASIKSHQVITFLSNYRELRWPMLYDYMFS